MPRLKFAVTPVGLAADLHSRSRRAVERLPLHPRNLHELKQELQGWVKKQSKPKTPLESVRTETEPTIMLKTNDLSNFTYHLIENTSLKGISHGLEGHATRGLSDTEAEAFNESGKRHPCKSRGSRVGFALAGTR